MFPHEGVHPQQVERARGPDGHHAGSTPPRSCWSIAAPRPSARSAGKVRTGSPDQEYVDHAGQEHRVWAIRDPDQQRTIWTTALAGARLLVADGHHRYAAYVALHDAATRDPRIAAAW